MKIFRIALILLVGIPSCSFGQTDMTALADLKALLYSEKEWVKVHVAEFLIWEDCDVDEVRTEFLKEELQFGHLLKYRIGIWRVLAQAALDNKERQYWKDKIVAVYNDVDGQDRLHAIETLAKLKVPVIDGLGEDMEGSMRLYTLWNYALRNEQVQEKVRKMLVEELINGSLTELEMTVVSYVMRYIGPLTKGEFTQIFRWIERNNLSLPIKSSLFSTLLISSSEEISQGALIDIKSKLIQSQLTPESLPHALFALAWKGDREDKDTVVKLYNLVSDQKAGDYNSDLHATGAFMLLKYLKRFQNDYATVKVLKK